MKSHLVVSLCLLLSSAASAHGLAAPGSPFSSLALGSQFVPVLVTCGTAPNPDCPRFLEPMERPYLIHYVTVGGRADAQCSFTPVIQRQKSDGSVNNFGLARFTLWGDGQSLPVQSRADNAVLTFPEPLRGEAGDLLGVSRAPVNIEGTCSVFATYGIEYLR